MESVLTNAKSVTRLSLRAPTLKYIGGGTLGSDHMNAPFAATPLELMVIWKGTSIFMSVKPTPADPCVARHELPGLSHSRNNPLTSKHALCACGKQSVVYFGTERWKKRQSYIDGGWLPLIIRQPFAFQLKELFITV